MAHQDNSQRSQLTTQSSCNTVIYYPQLEADALANELSRRRSLLNNQDNSPRRAVVSSQRNLRELLPPYMTRIKSINDHRVARTKVYYNVILEGFESLRKEEMELHDILAAGGRRILRAYLLMVHSTNLRRFRFLRDKTPEVMEVLRD